MSERKYLRIPITAQWEPRDNAIYLGIDGNCPDADEWGNRVSFYAKVKKEGSRLDEYLYRKLFYALAARRPEMWTQNPDIPRTSPVVECPAAGCKERGSVAGIKRHVRKAHSDLFGKVKIG